MNDKKPSQEALVAANELCDIADENEDELSTTLIARTLDAFAAQQVKNACDECARIASFFNDGKLASEAIQRLVRGAK